MKKVIKLHVLMLLLLIFLTACNTAAEDMKQAAEKPVTEPAATFTPEVEPVYEKKLERETEHFIIRYFSVEFSDTDKECVDRIEDSLESAYPGLVEHYGVKFSNKKTVEIHTDHRELHKAMGFPDAPDWACGGYGFGNILAASPLLPTPYMEYDNLVNTPLHEYVHLVVRYIRPSTPRWLNEGIAFYESKDRSLQWVNDTVSAGVRSGTVPTFDYLDTGDDYQAFAMRSGYQYMYTFIEFIVREYGYDRLVTFIKDPYNYEGTFTDDPYNFESAFGCTEDEIREQWIGFLEENYSGS